MNRKFVLLSSVLALSTVSLAAQPAQPAVDQAESQLAEIRTEISEVDSRLVELLNRRAAIVLRLAPIKQEMGRAVRDRAREQVVLEKVSNSTAGPLPAQDVRKIYREIMAAMRRLQTAN